MEECVSRLGDDPCYVVFDYEATRSDSSTLSKICFICYAPDSCTSLKAKFALQNFKESTKQKINVQKEMQINDKGDFTEREFADAFGVV